MTLRPALDDVRDRARAAFLGLALGDALGATVEFMLPREIRAAHGVHREISGGGWLKLRPGAVTDDTQMSVWLGRAIVNGKGWDTRRAAVHLAAWLRTGPADVGHTVRRGLRRFVIDGTLAGEPTPGDAGNGAAMRMLPVALLTLADEEALGALALEQARITHHHPMSDAACVHVGALVHRACLGLGMPRLRRASDGFVSGFREFAFSPHPGRSGGYVVETLSTVLHHLYASRSFEETLVGVVNQGGDADTTGAIAGAIAGAYHGLEGLPERWLRKLDPEVREEVVWLADRLVALSPLARGEPPRLAPDDG
ncbi:MAG: ADP-ribosyl-[dinitrogen reductase] hydrolase [Anaeromyxobacteraceae bacterium]